MREVWSNHATRHRNLRELPPARGLEGGDEYLRQFYQTVLAEVDAPHKSWFWEITKFSNRSAAAAWA
jgi:hypothetical protein